MTAPLLILTEAGTQFGLGHLMRCLAVREWASRAQRDTPIRLLVRGDVTESTLAAYGQHDAVNVDWLSELDHTLAAIRADKALVLLDSYSVDSDSYAAIAAAATHAEQCSLATLDDYGRPFDWRGIVVNPLAIDAHSLYPHSDERAMFLLGPRYALLRRDFALAECATVRQSVSRILVSLGGSPLAETVKQVSRCALTSFPEIEVDVVGVTEVDPPARAHGLVSTDELISLMQGADLCIAGAGQTLNELACLGVPAVALVLANNQVLNAAAWSELGFCRSVDARVGRREWEEGLRSAINHFGKFEHRRQASATGQVSVDGHGAERLLCALVESAGD